jgi:hypothetical protein
MSTSVFLFFVVFAKDFSHLAVFCNEGQIISIGIFPLALKLALQERHDKR